LNAVYEVSSDGSDSRSTRISTAKPSSVILTPTSLARRALVLPGARASGALRRDCGATSSRPLVPFAAISGDHLRRDQQHRSLTSAYSAGLNLYTSRS